MTKQGIDMTDSHSHQQRKHQTIEESLSALIDGETSDLEMHRVLKAADNNDELRQSWRRYQIISQTLKNNRSDVDLSVDLSARIKSAIADEPPLNTQHTVEQATSAAASSSAKRSIKSIWPDVGRFAIAASVAAAVVLGFQYTGVDQSPDLVASESTSSAPPADEQIVYEGLVNKDIVKTASHSPSGNKASIQLSKQPITINPGDLKKGNYDVQDLQLRLNRLMLEHVENASQNNYQGILPYARVPSGE